LATTIDCSIIARVRVEKNRSSPRSSVVLATTETSTVEQQQAGNDVTEQELDHDLMNRGNGGQAGKHQEGRSRGQKRDADGASTNETGYKRHRRNARRIQHGYSVDCRHVKRSGGCLWDKKADRMSVELAPIQRPK
jgi:hypothetical protein